MFEGLLQPGHLLILLVIVLLVFGPSKLPQIGGALGKTIRDFKHALDEQPSPPQQTSSDASKTSPPGKDS